MYEDILTASLKTIQAIPMELHVRGGLAGIVLSHRGEWSMMMAGDNLHFPLGTTYLKQGVRGVAEMAEARAGETEGPVAKEMLLGVGEVYRAIADYFERYAQVILHAAGENEKLRRIGENLQALSVRAPEHFDEALQAYYMLWRIRTLGGNGADIGRMDVHLREFFDRDIAAGETTEEEVLARILDFWELMNEFCSGDTLVNVMAGGRNADGSDAGNRLSVLMLEATKRCAKTEPHINVRVHPNLSPEIRKAMLEVQLMGQGQSTVFNDEVVIPSLMQYGVPEELACCYTNDGCTEVMLDGYSAIEFNHIDAVAVFELAFYNGDWAQRTYRKKSKYWTHRGKEYFATPDASPGFESGRVEDCGSFEEFYRCFLAQYRFQTRRRANELQRVFEDRKAGAASSLLVNGSFESVLATGKDYLRGGLPFEDYMIFSGSIPTVADCLIGVKKLVFEEKKYTVAQVKEAIRVNFEGYEPMRREMLAAPKFGNDIDEVDLLAADIAGHFCDWLDEYRQERGFLILPALIGWRFVDEAYAIAATPDGRRYADPIAEHYCATPGRAKNGPTAILRSVSKARDQIARAAGITACHLSLPRNLGENELEILDGISRSMVDGGLSYLSIGIYDAEILRKAQKNPEQYQDVIVRVWGYSARFVDLCVEMQEHVIARVENQS